LNLENFTSGVCTVCTTSTVIRSLSRSHFTTTQYFTFPLLAPIPTFPMDQQIVGQLAVKGTELSTGSETPNRLRPMAHGLTTPDCHVREVAKPALGFIHLTTNTYIPSTRQKQSSPSRPSPASFKASTLLQGFHPPSRLPPSFKASTLLQGFHPPSRLPPSFKASTLLQGFHPPSRLPPSFKASTLPRSFLVTCQFPA